MSAPTLKTHEKRGEIRSVAYRVNAIIGILIMFLGWVLPAPEPITDVGMRVLSVFIGMIYLFSACEVAWPSLLGILMLSLTGYTNFAGAVSASLGHSVVFQSTCAYIVAGTLNYYGVTEHIARWILSRKSLQGRPVLFSLVFLYCPWFIAIFTGSIAVIILFWAILYGIVEMVGYKKGDAFVSASHSETQGLTYIEALASGLCLVAYDDPCLRGVVRDGENGLLFPDDDDAMLAALQRALGPDGRALAQAAPPSVERFSKEAFVRAVERVYEDAIRAAAARRARWDAGEEP